jgi:hypothetical protein
MWRHPVLADIQPLTMALKHLDEGVITEWLSPPLALASNKE